MGAYTKVSNVQRANCRPFVIKMKQHEKYCKNKQICNNRESMSVSKTIDKKETQIACDYLPMAFTHICYLVYLTEFIVVRLLSLEVSAGSKDKCEICNTYHFVFRLTIQNKACKYSKSWRAQTMPSALKLIH